MARARTVSHPARMCASSRLRPATRMVTLPVCFRHTWMGGNAFTLPALIAATMASTTSSSTGRRSAGTLIEPTVTSSGAPQDPATFSERLANSPFASASLLRAPVSSAALSSPTATGSVFDRTAGSLVIAAPCVASGARAVAPNSARAGLPEGHPKYGGRQKGSRNKLGDDLRQMIMDAITETGSVGKDEKGEPIAIGVDGCKGFIKWLYLHEPKTAAALLACVGTSETGRMCKHCAGLGKTTARNSEFFRF